MNENTKWSTHDEKLTLEKSCGECRRLETTKDSKLYVQPPNLASKMPNLPLYLYRKLLPFDLNPMCRQKYDPDCGPPVVEWLLKPFPSVLVLNEGERGSHPELSTMNGARDGLECRVRWA